MNDYNPSACQKQDADVEAAPVVDFTKARKEYDMQPERVLKSAALIQNLVLAAG